MSDFDKEAERERLREKYEQEQNGRETTERMSELLLKGATMTNAHCGECSDPIFRYDGQEFCPTCEEVVADQEDTGTTDQGEAVEQSPSADGQTATGAEDTADDESDDAPLPAETGERAPATTPDREQRPRTPDPPARRDQSNREQASPAADAEGDLTDARASLERSLVRFAREAERENDPRRAREHLEAAHEAADALASLSEIR